MSDTVLQIVLRGVDDGASSTLESVLQQTLGLSEGQAKLGVSMLAATGATMGMVEAFQLVKDGLVSVVEQSAAWQTQLSQMQANTTLSTEQVQAMSAAVIHMSQQSGASLADLGAGYTHVANIMQDTTTAVNVLNVAQESAISTGGNVTSYAQTLARVLHEFSMSGNEAASAMDMLHTAAASGDLTLEQFTENSGNALAMAANYKVPLDQVSAAYIALTKHGMDAADANTQIADQFLRLTTVTPKVATELERVSKATGVDLVGDFTSSGLAAKGLTGIYADLTDAETKMGMSSEQAFAENMLLGDSLRGGRGLAIDVGTGYKDYNDVLAAVNDTVATAAKRQDDYNRAVATTAGQFDILKANASAMAVTIGGNQGPITDFLAVLNRTFAMAGTGADLFGTLASAWTSDADVGKALSAEVDHIGASVTAASSAVTTQTADLYDWGQAASEAGAKVAAAVGGATDGLAGAMGSAADVAAGSDQDAAAKAQDDARKQQLADYATAQKQAFTDSLAQAKTFYSDQAKTATDAATATKDAASAANQATLDSTKAEIDAEKTAYDDRMAADIKARQNQTTSALAELQKQETAANVAAAAANTAAGVQAQAANTLAGVQGQAAQKAADESDAAWKAQVTAIKDAATSGENALHDSNDNILKSDTTTANQAYATQISAVDGAVKAREEGDAREIHSHELATAATIAGIEREKTAALAAIDQETAAYAAQEAARVKQIDATLAASVKGLNDQLAAEQRANTERLAVNSITKASGATAGQELGQFFTASDAATADTEAAIAAKQAGNAALAQQDSAAASQQQATAQALSAQLSQIDQATADQMVAYKLQSDSTITADQVAALTDQATNQKQALADQLAAEKQSQADKKTATSAHYDDEKTQATAALESYKWDMAQSLQAFKDEKDQEKISDKAALDLKLTNIATQQTAENTRHADAIAKINAQAKADTDQIDALATKRKDDYTAQTAERTAAYTAATAARTADYARQTADRQAQALIDQATIKATGDADVLALQTAQKEADQDYPLRTKAAETHYKDVQGQIDLTYKQDVNAIQDGLKEHNEALDDRKKHMDDYTTATNTSWQTLIADAQAYAGAIAGQAAAQTALNAAQAAHQNATHSGAATGQGGAQGAPPSFAVAGPDGHDRTRGNAAVSRAIGYDGSGAYYHDGTTWCEQFAEDMTGLPNMGGTAYQAALNWGAKLIPGQTYPGPSLVYFSGPTAAGHVGVANGDSFTSVLDPPWNITTEPVSTFLAQNPGASFMGSVPLYAEGGVVPGPWGQPMPAIVHGGEEFLGLHGQRGTLADRGERIDYERLAQAVVTALRASPPVIAMDGRVVSDQVQTRLLQKQRSNPTLSFR